MLRPHWVCRAHGVCFPRVHCSGSRLPTGSGPCVACGSSFRVLHKSADSVAPAFCAFPSGAAQAARSLTGALSPVRCAFSPPPSQPQFLRASWVRAPCACSQELRPSRRMLTIQTLRKSLVRNWRPGCSLVGVPSLGPSLPLSPPPGLLPPSCGGWAGPLPVSSSLELLSPSFVPKQCRPLLSVLPPLAGGGCGPLGCFSAGSCY